MQYNPPKTCELVAKYIKSYAKMLEGKDLETKALMVESFSVAVQVLTRFDGLEPHEIVASVYVFCKDEKYKFISKHFEACIETAALSPDEFVHGLHKWCNALSAKLRHTEGGLEAFCSFSSLYRRLSVEKIDTIHVNVPVVYAYVDIICLMLNYIRPVKLDSSKALVGVTTDGRPISAPDPFALFTMPAFDFFCGMFNVKGYPAFQPTDEWLEKAYQRYGRQNIHNSNDEEELNRQAWYSQNTRMSLLPYINEFTYDIVPQQQFTCQTRQITLRSHDIDVAELRNKLRTSRRRTLPSNGITVTFEDSTEYFKTLLLKEITVDDEVILLYRLSIDKIGDLSGYYNTAIDYMYSLREAGDTDSSRFIEALVLYFYAVAVLDDEKYTDEKAKDHFQNFIYPIGAKSFGKGGRLLKTYPPVMGTKDGDGPRHNTDKYEAKERAINGYVRKLPAGQTASEEAQSKAKKMGYDLKTNETYVSPFRRTTFYLKKEDNNEDEA